MHAVFDATATLLPGTGVRTHIQLWAEALRKSAGPHSLTVFPLLGRLDPLEPGKSARGPLATAWRLALVRTLNRSGRAALGRVVGRADVFHASQHVHHLPAKMKCTATLFDMSCWTAPETHLASNIEATRTYAKRILVHADGIVANSGSAREDAVRILGLADARIEVIRPGIAPAFFNVDAASVERARQRYALPATFILWVGAVEPRKNIDTLLDAYACLKQDLREEWPLVLAGRAGWSSAATLARMRSAGHGWRYLGYVPERDLPAVTAAAAIFVFPSLYEGFGLPLAQAMAAGTASITSNVASMPEVADGCAALVDPRSSRQIAEALRRLILSPSERDRLAREGRSRAETYTWEKTALQTWRFLERIAG
jgi:glycosyltransferase involved in cell wall biosynthesis